MSRESGQLASESYIGTLHREVGTSIALSLPRPFRERDWSTSGERIRVSRSGTGRVAGGAISNRANALATVSTPRPGSENDRAATAGTRSRVSTKGRLRILVPAAAARSWVCRGPGVPRSCVHAGVVRLAVRHEGGVTRHSSGLLRLCVHSSMIDERGPSSQNRPSLQRTTTLSRCRAQDDDRRATRALAPESSFEEAGGARSHVAVVVWHRRQAVARDVREGSGHRTGTGGG